MSATITKHGDVPSNRHYEFVCDGCGCEFQCNWNEVKHDVNAGDKPYVTVACPDCSRTQAQPEANYKLGNRAINGDDF